jgi:glycerol-3-phosphate dehydrogenase subunit C
MRELEELLELETEDLDDSCCGIGGTFGFKAKNIKTSQEIGNALFDSLKRSGASVVVTECPTCKIQIGQGTGLPVIHPIELLDRALSAPEEVPELAPTLPSVSSEESYPQKP